MRLSAVVCEWKRVSSRSPTCSRLHHRAWTHLCLSRFVQQLIFQFKSPSLSIEIWFSLNAGPQEFLLLPIGESATYLDSSLDGHECSSTTSHFFILRDESKWGKPLLEGMSKVRAWLKTVRNIQQEVNLYILKRSAVICELRLPHNQLLQYLTF